MKMMQLEWQESQRERKIVDGTLESIAGEEGQGQVIKRGNRGRDKVNMGKIQEEGWK